MGRSRTGEGGGYLLESFFNVFILLFLLFLTLFMFQAGINTMLAGRAQSETAVYTAASGAWTGRAAQRCIQMLPGPVEFRSCRLFLQDPANPRITLRQIPEVCGQRSFDAATGVRQGRAQGPVGDCLNVVDSTRPDRLTPSSRVDAAFTERPQPLRLEVSYRQFFFNLCPFLPQVRQDQTREDCTSQSNRIVTRNIIFYSQTVRER